ncbi:hypothetical protein GC722_07575 [Auraticoccus sp. F435]|uniref:Uncharacterized protein n=1 Tax=Auraticoccus cholistanensis TaxID=2656650 RepID=A0A6A9UT77_9ACTN|nr:hypothetical protein [Auraticoccus cholistanensis]MVA75881.1 hypothetical protein [Auraticoccus cholistanensis]
MSSVPSVPTLPGVVFEHAPTAVVTVVNRVERPREVLYGDARGQIGNGDRTSWGFAAVRLDRRLPHLVLENRRGGGIISTDASEGVARGQRLRLGQPFDATFALHCPQGYEHDARQLLTPDVVAVVLEYGWSFDLEVVDDWLLVHVRRPVSALDPATRQRLTTLVGLLGGTVGSWARWCDPRQPGSPDLAAEGRRLRPVSSWRWLLRLGVVAGAMLSLGVLWEVLT